MWCTAVVVYLLAVLPCLFLGRPTQDQSGVGELGAHRLVGLLDRDVGHHTLSRGGLGLGVGVEDVDLALGVLHLDLCPCINPRGF